MPQTPTSRDAWSQLKADLWNGESEGVREVATEWRDAVAAGRLERGVNELRMLRLLADVIANRDPGTELARELDEAACMLAVRLAGVSERGALRIWVDDDRENRRAPDGWVHVLTAWEAIGLLATGRVIELSLDHDLADEAAGLGRDVVNWLAAEQTRGNPLWPADLHIHSANANAVAAMDAEIMRFAGEVRDVERRIVGAQIDYRLG